MRIADVEHGLKAIQGLTERQEPGEPTHDSVSQKRSAL
jgi:hypothetical protein